MDRCREEAGNTAADFRTWLADCEESRLKRVLSEMNRIHNRILLVVPLVLRRMAWMTGGSRTRVFYYVDFSLIKKKMDQLFTNAPRAVVLVLPQVEPRKVTAWLAVMSAIHLWVSCGTRVPCERTPHGKCGKLGARYHKDE
ncbi:hypothetical protein GCK32_022802 [Trichostrongylus colubriformis]|uniref:Uncharacterized protein n=1 Tax=Trichostrongylus colubriformis TaxID=6319 RepID=A0AAN8IAR7_TRICO